MPQVCQAKRRKCELYTEIPFIKRLQAVIRAANADFKNCHEAVVAFDHKVCSLSSYLLFTKRLQLRQAAAAHTNISIPTAAKKRVSYLSILSLIPV